MVVAAVLCALVVKGCFLILLVSCAAVCFAVPLMLGIDCSVANSPSEGELDEYARVGKWGRVTADSRA
jgi:hypothetical protein